jgi:hypothetical protein
VGGRAYDALCLGMLRAGEWVGDLSPMGKAMLGVVLFVLLSLLSHFGVIPRRHGRSW